ncbi:Amine oxidase [Fusarium falciforme]|uniref:Amine oxidase n=1 Tax=Fusarium falciforme TaxID=195108 RepID=UPI002301B667|nr:Amine oxidase [Fusarium falciforme]WAO97239.1 Amine oxidase [Fusarium falciforme]
MASLPYPFDPLSPEEIKVAVTIVKKAHGDVKFNVVSLEEPRKAEMTAWLANPDGAHRPRRVADVVVIGPTGKIFQGSVDLETPRISKWKQVDGAQPIITPEELAAVEHGCRKDAKVIEQCLLSGVAKGDMHKVYCDPWTIGYDERFGSGKRLQQALMYYRPDIDNCQYHYPLDFCPIWDPIKQEVIAIDIPKIRRPLVKSPPLDYHHLAIERQGGHRKDLKPINITQPQGVSFNMTGTGRELEWQNWKFHIGFNYREGIVFNNITFNDKGTIRPIFYRMSIAEMVVPYGNPEHPHQRKHAFDLGEYGAGYLTNSLALGCDCKGSIYYLDAYFSTQSGSVRKVKNAICIHEEDDGILFKHTDFRDDSTIITRGRKLVVQQVFTAANYEYAIAWTFHQDGTIQPDIRLTGILNTYVMYPGEDTNGWGTEVAKGVNAHNHQHLFCLRINPNLDGTKNSVHMVDAVPSSAPVGSPENFYGNAFYAKRTRLETTSQAMTDYDGSTSRTWDIVNENKLNPSSGKPVSYKLVSREVPGLLPKEGSLVWNRAAFARHAVHVTKYNDDQLWVAGDHVPQTSGEPSRGITEWIGDGTESIVDTDIVLWHTFGITHFPSPEDYPIMPREPITLLLRPRHFFSCNPVLDVPPSYSVTPSQVAAKGEGALDATDRISRLALGVSRL